MSDDLIALLSRREVLRRGGVALGGLTAAQLLAACGGGSDSKVETASSSGVSKGGGKPIATLTWAITGDILGFDYTKAYDLNTNPVVNNVCETLLRMDPSGKLIPNLAESYDQVDPVTWVYKIRPGVKFHDGSPLTADDVAFSLNRHLDPEVGSFLGVFLSSVDSIEETGPLEVTVKLKQPDWNWRYSPALNSGAITSRKWVEKRGKSVGTPKVGIVGTGPYEFVSWTRGSEIVLKRFDGYWNKERALKVERAVFKIIEEESTIVQGLAASQIDGTFNLSGTTFASLSRFSQVKRVTASSYNVSYLAFNVERKPWDDPRVRQALSMAIDKAGVLASAYRKEGELVRSPVTPNLWANFEPEMFDEAYEKLPTYERDIEKAKELIRAAGAEGARGKVLVATDYDVAAGVAIQAAAKAIGLDIQPQRIPFDEKQTREFSGKRRDYDMTITIWGSDVPDPAGNLALTFLSTNPIQNATQYRNPEVDKLIKGQATETDPKRRAQMLIDIQDQVVRDQPWIVLYQTKTLLAQNSRVGGYQVRPLYYWDSFLADLSGT